MIAIPFRRLFPAQNAQWWGESFNSPPADVGYGDDDYYFP
jgi:hypothetical protein